MCRNALGFGGVVTAGESALCIDMAITPLQHHRKKIMLKNKAVHARK
jgi:hypothetical protein